MLTFLKPVNSDHSMIHWRGHNCAHASFVCGNGTIGTSQCIITSLQLGGSKDENTLAESVYCFVFNCGFSLASCVVFLEGKQSRSSTFAISISHILR